MKLSPLPARKAQPKPSPSTGIIRMGEWVKLIEEIHHAETPEGFYSLNEYCEALSVRPTCMRKYLKLLQKKRLAVSKVLPGRNRGNRNTCRPSTHWKINEGALEALKKENRTLSRDS